ncbi:hypothetical protein ACQJBY_004817 [Aegilops geniculata]
MVDLESLEFHFEDEDYQQEKGIQQFRIDDDYCKVYDPGSLKEIQPIASHDSKEPGPGPVKLMTSPRVLQNEVEFLQMYHLIVMSAVAVVLFLEALRSEVITGFKNTVPISYVEDFGVVIFVSVLVLQLVLRYSRRSIFGGVWTCNATAAMVLQHYALLLMINRRYIRIAIIPVIILVFIGALANKFKENPSIQYNSSEEVPSENGIKSTEDRRKMAMIPCCLQISFVIWTQLSGQQGGTFVFSHFPVFINSSLGTLAVMVAAPPIGASHGVVKVLPVLHKSCLIMLLITTWTIVTEWLGEGIILVCMPEFVALLLWFTNPFDHASRTVSFNTATSRILGVLVPNSLAVLLSFAYDRKILASWYRSGLYISSSSCALSYLHMWMLPQWPGRTSNSNAPIKLLKYSVEICFHSTLMLAACSIFQGIIVVTLSPNEILKEAKYILYAVMIIFGMGGVYLSRGTNTTGQYDIFWIKLRPIILLYFRLIHIMGIRRLRFFEKIAGIACNESSLARKNV